MFVVSDPENHHVLDDMFFNVLMIDAEGLVSVAMFFNPYLWKAHLILAKDDTV